MAIEKDAKLREIEALAARKELTFETFKNAALESNQVEDIYNRLFRSIHSLGREDLRKAIKANEATNVSWTDYTGKMTLEEAQKAIELASNAQTRFTQNQMRFFYKQEKAPTTSDKLSENPSSKPPRSGL